MPDNHTKTPNRTCIICGKPFYAAPGRIAGGGGKYCSRACYAKNRANSAKPYPCPVCGKITLHRQRALAGRDYAYCSMKCRGIGRRVGRVINVYGYVIDWMPDGTRYLEHRWVMEQKIGRPLRPDEDVHHKDGNKTNNHPDNLELLSHTEHAALHSRQQPKLDRWSRNHDRCRACGSTTRSHAGQGLCKRCYMRAYKPQYRAERRAQGLPPH